MVCDERGELPRGGQAGHVPLNGGLLGSSMADVRARGRKAHSQQGVGEGSCIVIVLRRLYTKENKRDTLICGTLVFYCAVLRRGALTFIRFSHPRAPRVGSAVGRGAPQIVTRHSTRGLRNRMQRPAHLCSFPTRSRFRGPVWVLADLSRGSHRSSRHLYVES